VKGDDDDDNNNNIKLGRDTSDGIATGYGLDGAGIESRCGQDSRVRPDRP
jgi:hypothetical protein